MKPYECSAGLLRHCELVKASKDLRAVGVSQSGLRWSRGGLTEGGEAEKGEVWRCGGRGS